MVDVGEEVQLPVVDLWTSMQAHPDWQTQFLCDGLHFTPAGNKFVYKQLQPAIDKAYPSLRYAVALSNDACREVMHSAMLTLHLNHSHTLLQQSYGGGAIAIWMGIMQQSRMLAVCLQDTEDDFRLP